MLRSEISVRRRRLGRNGWCFDGIGDLFAGSEWCIVKSKDVLIL
jgi:hypothetical protein